MIFIGQQNGRLVLLELIHLCLTPCSVMNFFVGSHFDYYSFTYLWSPCAEWTKTLFKMNYLVSSGPEPNLFVRKISADFLGRYTHHNTLQFKKKSVVEIYSCLAYVHFFKKICIKIGNGDVHLLIYI